MKLNHLEINQLIEIFPTCGEKSIYKDKSEVIAAIYTYR